MIRVLIFLLLLPALAMAGPELEITMVGNAGVQLSDGETTLLIDLPYVSGAHGYEEYDPSALDPIGEVVSVITHHHTDHFSPKLWLPIEDWKIIGPPSVLKDFPAERIITGEEINVGRFDIRILPTPHTDDHRSYRIHWEGQTLHFVGDTEATSELTKGPRVDVLFCTAWLACIAEKQDITPRANRTVGYHRWMQGEDEICGDLEFLPQGSQFKLEPKTLYTKAPEDWRPEIIPFPLSFAPDLKLEGMEELRFAPGMFDPTAEDFFTYTFVWHLDSPADLSPANLKPMLLEYYQGLYRSVSKLQQADPDKFEVTLDANLQGTIQWVEPFRTGKAQTLNIRVRQWSCEDKTQWAFFEVSPQEAGHELWSSMEKQKAGECP